MFMYFGFLQVCIYPRQLPILLDAVSRFSPASKKNALDLCSECLYALQSIKGNFLYEKRHEKNLLFAYAKNKGADQLRGNS